MNPEMVNKFQVAPPKPRRIEGENTQQIVFENDPYWLNPHPRRTDSRRVAVGYDAVLISGVSGMTVQIFKESPIVIPESNIPGIAGGVVLTGVAIAYMIRKIPSERVITSIFSVILGIVLAL